MKLLIKLTPVCLTLCLCLMFFAGPAGAQIKPGAITLSPSIGRYVFEGNQDLDNGPTYGLSLGYNFDEHWAAEAVFNYVDTALDTDNNADGRNVNVYLYHVDALYHFTPYEKVVPYFAAGVGGITFDPDESKNDKDYAVNYGGGLKYFLTENVALRGDVRHIISFDETRNNLLYTVGLTFAFGGEKAQMAAVQPSAAAEEEVVILASEPKVEEKVRAAKVEAKIVVLALEDIHFDFNKSTLTPEAQTILKRNIRLLKENPNAQIRIAGYTSAAGTKEYNQKLSERRSKAVQEYLVTEGIISQSRLSGLGYGEKNPAMYEATPKELYSDAAKANMRVLFEIMVK